MTTPDPDLVFKGYAIVSGHSQPCRIQMSNVQAIINVGQDSALIYLKSGQPIQVAINESWTIGPEPNWQVNVLQSR